METVVEKKRSRIESGMDSIVICEFGHRQKIVPIVLLIIDEAAKKLFEDRVDALGLTIGLRMISGTEFASNLHRFEDHLENLRGELQTTIGNDIVRKTMMLEDVGEGV